MKTNMPSTETTSSRPDLSAAAAQVKALRDEESQFLSMAKSNEIEAMVRAYKIGVIIDTEVDKGYGKSGVKKFASEIGISAQAAYDYVYLARGAYQEQVIRENPLVSRKYYQVVGRRINAFEDFLGMLLSFELITTPLWKDSAAEAKEPDIDRINDIASLLDSTRKHIRTDLRAGYLLSGDDFDFDIHNGMRHLRLPTKHGNEANEKKAMVEIGLMSGRIATLLGYAPLVLDMSAYSISRQAVDTLAKSERGATAKGILREARRQRKIRATLEQATPEISQRIEECVLHGRAEIVLQDRTKFPESMVDVVITDPPYSDEYYREWRPETCIAHDAEATNVKEARLVGRVAELLVSRKIIKDRLMWFSFCPIDYVHVFLPPILKAFSRLPCKHQVLVWDKQRTPKVGGDWCFSRQTEAILYVSVNRPLGTVGPSGQTTPLHSSLFNYRAVDQDGNNFFWKPIPLLKHLIALSTYDLKTAEAERQVILDPFAGSGSTGVAAIECKRAFRMIESHPTQYATAKAVVTKAWIKHTTAT